MRELVDIKLASFNESGITVVVNGVDADTLTFALCKGWVGEFIRIAATSQVFALQQVRQATEKDRHQSVCGLNVLWPREEFHEADQAICAFLPLAYQTPVSEKQAIDGADHHES